MEYDRLTRFTNFLIYSINNKLSLTHNSIKTTQRRFQNRLRLDTYEHIEDNTSIRACNLQFPENLIKTTDNFFIAFEPTGHLISVENNISLLGDYNFNFSGKNEYINNQDSLATNSEWKALSDSIQYKGLKTILAELLYTSLYFDDVSCNNFKSDFNPTHYDSSILKLLTADNIEHELLRQMNLS